MPELTWELMFGFLALVFIALLFLIIAGLGGGLQQFNVFGCEESPPPWKFWCMAGEEVGKDYLIARQSFDALACAINVVTLHDLNHSCLSVFKPTKQAGFAAFAAEQGQASVECKEKGEAIIKNQFEFFAENDEKAIEKCKRDCEEPACQIIINNVGIQTSEGPGGISTVYKYSCTQKEKPIECEIKNFNLPQEVGKAEEWIAGYGDPQFIVYWQNFPQGEDAAWTGYTTWLKDLGTIILFAIPVGRAGKVIKKGAERVLVGTVEKVSTSLTKAGAKMFKRISGHLTEKGVSQKVIAVFSRSAEKLERRAALEGLKEADITLFNAIKNKLESLKNVKKIMKVAGVATTSALVAAWIDSVNEKYIPQPGNLVLKRPYKDLDTESINTATKPVLLDKPGLTSDIKGHVNFYLASPCSANITIKEDWAKCEQYGYDALEGTVYCNSSIWTELAFGLPECNFSKDIVDSQSITPIYDKIDSIIKGDMSFFEEKKINIPWLDGYLTDMPETSGTARLWINEKLELKNVLWRDTYILNKDRVYRIYIYNTSTGNIILDIYPNDTCESVISENPEPYKSISCDELRKEPKGQLKSPDQIKSLIQTVKDKREKDIIEVKPTNSIKANEIIIEGYKFSTDCSEGNNKICIRSAEVSMWKDEERYWFFPNKRSCIDINMSGEEKVYLYNDDVNYFLDWGCEEQFRTVVPSGYGIAYKYYPTTILVFKNMTSDTTWDYLQIQFIKGGVGDFPENTTIGLADISGGKANLFTMDRCKTPAIYLRPEKNEVEDHNFCYSEPATWTKVVFVATLIADVALTTFGAGVGVSIAVGLTGGVVYVMTEKAEKWP